jgi:hypothetical protein
VFTNSIGQWRANATRRRIERDVRVHRETGQVPSPTTHRRAPRWGAQALHQIQAEAPVQPDATPRAAALPVAPLALADLRCYRDRLLGWAADDETTAADLTDRATRYRAIAAGYDQLLALPEALALLGPDAPPAPRGDEHARRERGPRCYGCNRPGDTAPCWNGLEGREVPLCPRCHPSADLPDDQDPDEPERVDEQLPETMTAAPPSFLLDPATLPPPGMARWQDPVTVPTGWWNAPGPDDDTLTTLEPMDGAR